MISDTLVENVFTHRQIKEQFSIYVDDIKKLEKIESNKRRFSMLIIIGSIIGYPLIWFVFNYWGYHFGLAFFCLFIISCMVLVAINMSRQAELNTIKNIVYSFKQYVILQLLEQKEDIFFKIPIDDVGYAVVTDILNEIHQFDPTIYLVEHIEYAGNKKIQSIKFTNIDLEKLKKIINLNALEHFDYAPIL